MITEDAEWLFKKEFQFDQISHSNLFGVVDDVFVVVQSITLWIHNTGGVSWTHGNHHTILPIRQTAMCSLPEEKKRYRLTVWSCFWYLGRLNQDLWRWTHLLGVDWHDYLLRVVHWFGQEQPDRTIKIESLLNSNHLLRIEEPDRYFYSGWHSNSWHFCYTYRQNTGLCRTYNRSKRDKSRDRRISLNGKRDSRRVTYHRCFGWCNT